MPIAISRGLSIAYDARGTCPLERMLPVCACKIDRDIVEVHIRIPHHNRRGVESGVVKERFKEKAAAIAHLDPDSAG